MTWLGDTATECLSHISLKHVNSINLNYNIVQDWTSKQNSDPSSGSRDTA